jgi:hypothetical protein
MTTTTVTRHKSKQSSQRNTAIVVSKKLSLIKIPNTPTKRVYNRKLNEFDFLFKSYITCNQKQQKISDFEEKIASMSILGISKKKFHHI